MNEHTKHVLINAAQEIENLRRINTLLSAKVEVMENMFSLFNSSPNSQNRAMTVDVVWQIHDVLEKNSLS